MMARKTRIFTAVLVLFVLYAAIYIYRTSFVIDGTRYFSLFDDAMISMTYAKNLVAGHGPVWNPGGERVEGYSNPLWMLYMALFHLLPIAKAKISLCIQLSGALFLLINLLLVRKNADTVSGNSLAVALLAAVLTAFYLPLNTWSLQGMEVGILTLIVGLVVARLFRSLEQGTFAWEPYLLLGISTLIRMDMFVTYTGILGYLFLVDRRHRRQHALYGVLTGVFFFALQTGFRMWYYGEILPNTYYLKATGYPLLLRMSRGLYVFINFVFRAGLLLFILPVAVLLFKRDKYTLLLFWVFLVQVLYSIYIGGDAWEDWGGSNRFIVIAMPLYFILFSFASVRIGEIIKERLSPMLHFRRLVPWLAGFFVAVSLISFNALSGVKALFEWTLLSPPFATVANKTMVELGLLLNRITDENTRVAVIWAGAIPYYAERPMIDMLGKNDKYIARQPMHFRSKFTRYANFYPGHIKWDFRYTLEELQPDIVTQTWFEAEGAEMPYLAKYYRREKIGRFELYILKDRDPFKEGIAIPGNAGPLS